jgi:hypothetical protein
MTQSRTKLLAMLRRLYRERQRLVRRLTGGRELAIGTVTTTNRKCGNPSCRCAKGLGHLQTVFLFKDKKEGRRRCKLIRRADEARMLRAGEGYREFRKDMKQIRAIDLKEKQILMALAEERAIHYE